MNLYFLISEVYNITTMRKTIIIDRNHSQKMTEVPLSTLKTLLDSGVVEIKEMEILQLPSKKIDAYLFLKQQKQMQQKIIINDQYVVSVIDELLVNRYAFIEGREVQNVDLVLEAEIIDAIANLYPFLHKRYQINTKIRPIKDNPMAEDQKNDRIEIPFKNRFGVANFIKLCLTHIRKHKQLKLSLQKIMKLIEISILPFYFEVDPSESQEICEAIIDIIKSLICFFQTENVQEKLSQIFSKLYQIYWFDLSCDYASPFCVGQLERHFTLLQLIHTNRPYHKEFLAFGCVCDHIMCLFQYRGQNKASVHRLAIDVYERVVKDTNQYNTNTKTFINLFNILSSYGVHLIKDVWPSFYALVESKQASLFNSSELIQLILWKLESHENNNVIKHCLHQLLKNSDSKIFENDPRIIYSTLIRMLNLGVHYLDALFHMDSKYYPLVAQFFLKFYNDEKIPLEVLEQHLTWFVQSIVGLGSYDHALVALFMVFKRQTRKSTFLGKELLERVKKLCGSAYVRYPIRKRFQMVDSILMIIENHRNHEIDLSTLLDFLVSINKEYFIPSNMQKIKKIIKGFDEEKTQLWLKDESEDIILEIKMNVNFEKEDYELSQLLKKIKKLELMSVITESHLDDYMSFIKDMFLDYGESQYKSCKQRFFMLSVLYELLTHFDTEINHQIKFSRYLEAFLNIIAMLSMMKPDEEERALYFTMQIKIKICEIIHVLMVKTYRFQKGELFSDREEERVIVARMLQWALDSINSEFALDIIMTTLRARITVLREKAKRKEIEVEEENLFEETLYELYSKVTELQESNWKVKNQLSFIGRDKLLRLKVLLTTVLINDPSHLSAKKSVETAEINDIIDCYDFQRYEEVCWLIEAIFFRQKLDKTMSQDIKMRFSEEQGKKLVNSFELLLENMIHSLEYSLEKKEIMALAQSSINVMFSFVTNTHKINSAFVQFLLKLIETGERYLIFQRTVTFLVVDKLIEHFDIVSKTNCEQMMPLIVRILSIEEYRGYDSSVYCFEENSQYVFYSEFAHDIESNYNGAIPRFIFIQAFKDKIIKRYQKGPALSFYSKMINICLDLAMTPVIKEKMFLSGKNKLKLQIWQFLLIFEPEILLQSLGEKNFENMVLKCIENIANSSISEIKYYSQLFLMKILIKESMFRCLTPSIILCLQNGLTSSFGNVNRSISYIVTSGILIQHVLEMNQKDHQHFLTIKESFQGLYNALLTYVCSSVAYFRGLSQYFCLQTVTAFLQTNYVAILRQNYLLDPETKVLKGRLKQIIESYVNEIKTWTIQPQILQKIPNDNLNVVCDHYYMEVLKILAVELSTIVKNEDGFTAYRNIWKKNVLKGQKEVHEEEAQIQKEEGNESGQEENGVFQRKIDLTMDLIYGNESNSHLKILITSSKNEALLGHLARTGEIFGIEELIIPNIKSIELDSFKSISVTAERWLKIGGLNQDDRSSSITEALITNKSKGYQLIKLSKNKSCSSPLTASFKMSQKCLLILDECSCFQSEHYNLIDHELQIGEYFSLHVQASIFIWEYFKTYVEKK